MRNVLCFLASGILFSCALFSLEVDYSSICNADEVVLFETQAIMNSATLSDKAEGYISRAESYLLMGKDKEALGDYEEGYFIAQTLSDEEKKAFSFRALFGSTIAYFNEDLDEEGWEHFEMMNAVLDTMRCSSSHRDDPSSLLLPCASKPQDQLPAGRQLIGPDRMTIEECEDAVRNTEKQANYLITYATRHRDILYQTILNLANEARACCRAGRSWKSCLQPLADKWSHWDNQWKRFEIPPYPDPYIPGTAPYIRRK